MTDPGTIEQQFVRFLVLHETRAKMRDEAKKVNKEFKDLNDLIHVFLGQQAGRALQVNAKYSVQLRTKKKSCGLTIPLIGEGYVGFHGSHGRVVADLERDKFLASLKALRKEKHETVEEVHIVATQ